MELKQALKSIGYQYILLFLFLLALCVYLCLYKLGHLVGGVSANELVTYKATYGWHGIYHNATFLPINILRSIIFKLFNPHGQNLLRLPSAIFGIMSIVFYYLIVYFWHGKRTAVLSSFLFACAAFTLHVSRLATNDIVYYWGILTLVLNHALYYRFSDNRLIGLLNFFTWGLLLTIPGFVYFVVLDIILQRNLIKESWEDIPNLFYRLFQLVLLVLWLPIVVNSLFRSHLIKLYLGLPEHFPTKLHILKNFGAVIVHLFIRGPQYPDLWLGRLPVLD